METTTPEAKMPKWTITATEYKVEITAMVATRDEAREIAATFPKSVNVKATGCCTKNAPGYSGYEFGSDSIGMVHIGAILMADGVNGGRNEAGIKRVNRVLAILGDTVEYETPFSNSLTREALDEILGR